ncbi:integrin alpha-M-like, partial [Sardina pilchardus]|uniref:integrin alpha-M-like n=1 Tax=Sardina pilchardus TaxID=27697 RepID=UPI002E0F5786
RYYGFQASVSDTGVSLLGLEGQRGRFGSSLASLADLNGDGIRDVAVGAPLEDNGQGSVYIFNGRRGGINPTYSQRIAGWSVRSGLRFFGLTVAQSALDQSGDGLPDIAVGSKGAVLLLRSRPIVLIVTNVTFEPSEVPKSIYDCTSHQQNKASVCFSMTKVTKDSLKGLQAKLNYTLSLDFVRQYSRAFFTAGGTDRRENKEVTLSLRRTCFEHSFFVLCSPVDVVNPVDVQVAFSFQGLPIPSADQLTPTLSISSPNTTDHQLSFEIDCGEDKKCIDQIHINFDFSGSTASTAPLPTSTLTTCLEEIEAWMKLNFLQLNIHTDHMSGGDTVEAWMKLNFLQLNSSKTEAILVGTQHQLRSSTITNITFSGQNISLSTSVTNLGVKMDPHLTFDTASNISTLTPSKPPDLLMHPPVYKHEHPPNPQNQALQHRSIIEVGIAQEMSVRVTVKNKGENSYGTRVSLSYPAGLSYRTFTKSQGRVECSSLDSTDGLTLGQTDCSINRPILQAGDKADFVVQYGIDESSHFVCVNYQYLSMTHVISSSDNNEHHPSSQRSKSLDIGVKYGFDVILKSFRTTNFIHFVAGDNHLQKPVIQELQVTNKIRGLNLTVVIHVPVRLQGKDIWTNVDSLQIQGCSRGRERNLNITDLKHFFKDNKEPDVNCSIAVCLEFRCDSYMKRDDQSHYRISGNVSSEWIEQTGLRAALFHLVSSATLEYNDSKYIFFSTDSSRQPPVSKMETLVEVYEEPDLLKAISGGVVGGLILVALMTTGLVKLGFFNSQYQYNLQEAHGGGEIAE